MNTNKIAAAVVALLVTSGATAPAVPKPISVLAQAAETQIDTAAETETPAETLPEEQPEDEESLPETILVDDEMEFTIYEDEAELTWTKYDMSGTVVIPETVEGYPVTAIGERAFAYNMGIVSIVLPKTVKKIGERAFLHCKGLEKIDIPETTTDFGMEAFFGTPWLEELIEFYSGTGLAVVNDIVIDGSLCSGDVEIFDGYRGIAAGAFWGNEDIRKVYIGNGVEFIGEEAFEYCDNLDTAEIDWFVSKIGERAFYCCPKLHSVLLQNPECEIFTSPDTICNSDEFSPVYNGYIASVPGYDVEAFAEKLGIKFTDLKSGAYAMIEEDGVEYHNYGAYAVAAKISGVVPAELTIPSEVRGIPVVAIGEGAFSGYERLESVVIPESVKTIERNAFYKCENLETVRIEGAADIGYRAFYGCGDLENIILPDGLEYISDSAFEFCTSLSSVTIPDSVWYIGDAAFKDCHAAEEIVISSGLEVLGKEAFSRCVTAKSITFSSEKTKLRTISEKAFNNCSEMKSFEIPSSVEVIGEEAFLCCGELEEITIPGNVWSIDTKAFDTCVKLQRVFIEEGVDHIEPYAFVNCNGLEELELPQSLKSIGEGAFKNCRSLEVICLPDGITEIERDTFAYCCMAKKIYIPDTVTSISEYAFDNLAEIEEIVVPKSVEYVGVSAFANCPGLKRIYFMNPNTYIAFSDTTICTTSEPEGFFSMPGYGNGVYAGTIYGYKDSSAEEYARHFNCNFEELEEVYEEPEVQTSAFMGFIVSNGAASLECCDPDYAGEVVVPSEIGGVPVKYISRGAFSKCRNITSITLSDSVIAIDDYAFKDSVSLKTVNIPESVKYIGKGAFEGCASLSSIDIPYGIVCIEENTFAGCDSLTDVVLPESVQSINNDAFCCCRNLKSLTILNPFCFMTQNSDLICNLYSGSEVYFEGVIRAAEGSRAERYAQVAGYRFEAIGDKTETGVAGDANLDKDITLADSLAVLQYVANSNKYPLPDIAMDNADVFMRGDGITASDAVSIQKYDLHMIKALPESWQKGANPIK